ncbi:hypothetical protein K2173_011618 [Erythroxylum novogranatense]|uniref:DUF4283 domain-containing protein n=1 Tax=Erythroxylum novogranatense TaxID=1862640 RepID=A0AAV8U872_9ROSI|nr:hypothetical protein K2173_011618 [Erythroxylum novogranatense]
MARKKPKDSVVALAEGSSSPSSGQPLTAVKPPTVSSIGPKSVSSRAPSTGPKKASLKIGKGVQKEILLEQDLSEGESDEEVNGAVSPASSESRDSVEELREEDSSLPHKVECPVVVQGASTAPVVDSGSALTGTQVVAEGSEKVDVSDKPSFASLFRNNRDLTQGFRLEHVPAEKEVTILAEDRLDLEREWGFCLVVVFTGRFPGTKAVEGLITQWGARTSVLVGGPYVLYGKTLLLKTLAPGFSFNFKDFMAMPLWIKFLNVPLDLWTDKGLSKIGSMVGKPICSNLVTTKRARVGYARLLVEVDVSKRPVSNFDVLLPEGTRFTQHVVYETFPSYCCDCKHFGHNVFICKKQSAKSQRWVPKGKGPQPVKEWPPLQGNAPSGASHTLDPPSAAPPPVEPLQVQSVVAPSPAAVVGPEDSSAMRKDKGSVGSLSGVQGGGQSEIC